MKAFPQTDRQTNTEISKICRAYVEYYESVPTDRQTKRESDLLEMFTEDS
jgi:hypothetical protein